MGPKLHCAQMTPLNSFERRQAVNDAYSYLRLADSQRFDICRFGVRYTVAKTREAFLAPKFSRRDVLEELQELGEAAAKTAKLLNKTLVRKALEYGYAARDTPSKSECIPELLRQHALLASCNEIVSEVNESLGLKGNTGQKGPWDTIELPPKALLVIFSQRLWKFAFQLEDKPKFGDDFQLFLATAWSAATGETNDAWRNHIDKANFKDVDYHYAPAHVVTRANANDLIDYLEKRLLVTRSKNLM